MSQLNELLNSTAGIKSLVAPQIGHRMSPDDAVIELCSPRDTESFTASESLCSGSGKRLVPAIRLLSLIGAAKE